MAGIREVIGVYIGPGDHRKCTGALMVGSGAEARILGVGRETGYGRP